MLYLFGAMLTALYGLAAMVVTGGVLLAACGFGWIGVDPKIGVSVATIPAGCVIYFWLFRESFQSTDQLEIIYRRFCLGGLFGGIAVAWLPLFVFASWIGSFNYQ